MSHGQRRLMPEGKLLQSKHVALDTTGSPTPSPRGFWLWSKCRSLFCPRSQEGEMLYVERVGFKDWHVSLHYFYVISDRLCTGGHILEQRWNYNDFCDITVRLEDYTFVLHRQVESIVLVRSFRSIPIDDFERMARPLLFKQANKL